MNFTDSTTMTSKLASCLLGALVLTFGLVGCDSLTEGYDQNPNLPTDATADLVLNSAEVATILYQDGNHARIAAMWTEQLDGTERQYAGVDGPSYNLTATDVNNMWITGYSEAIGDLIVVKEKAQEANNDLILGIAQTLEALNFGTTTALHGDVPYTEAGQGNDNLNPQFDPQLEIYDGAISTFDEAVSNLEAGGISPGERDEFFGGDAESWIQTANTLKARYMLHVAHNDEGPVADYGFEDVYQAAQAGIQSSEFDFIAPHGDALSVDANPFFQFRNDRSTDLTAQGSYAAQLLDESTDVYRGNAKTDETARFNFYFVESEDFGYDMNFDGYFARDADYPLATYVENELIKAEAALHSGQGLEVALEALNNARAANDAQFGPGAYEPYELADFAAGGVANPEGRSQAAALLHEILEEKYLSVFAHIEAFNDMRRTENFIGIPSPDEPQRFPIAQSEVTGNENVPDPIPGVFDITPANQATYPTP